ncbi:MAG TPA: hypothetical protein VJ974_00135 [Geopsychrobacteraceae bacterium]|nr:hypothetical protein [Geopsychrobacteraceae bacterium]
MIRSQVYRTISLVLILLLISVGSLNASSATVLVSATVLPWVNMDIRQNQKNYTVSPDDIERNYIDILSSATVDVETNVSVLILTLVSSDGEQIVASISGENRFDNTLKIALTENEKYANHITRDLDFRVILDRDSQPGTHDLNAWLSIQAF